MNGGVSWVGLFLSFLGGAAVGIGHFLVLYFCSIPPTSLPQWKIIPIAAIAGLVGSIIDSLLGATLQYSGTFIYLEFFFVLNKWLLVNFVLI